MYVCMYVCTAKGPTSFPGFSPTRRRVGEKPGNEVAKGRLLNQFGTAVFVWCGKSVKFDRVCGTFVEFDLGSTHVASHGGVFREARFSSLPTGRDERRARLKTPLWEATTYVAPSESDVAPLSLHSRTYSLLGSAHEKYGV